MGIVRWTAKISAGFTASITALILSGFADLEAQDRLELEGLEFPDLKDSSRKDRRVPIKVHHPRKKGHYPLVIFSHGGGGTWDSHLDQAKDLASHGFVVLCTEHVFSNIVKVRQHARRAKGTLRQRILWGMRRTTTDPKAVLERPQDIRFAIDRAIEWSRKHPKLKGRIDTDRIAVAGHSYGAYTVLVACGARPILDHLDPPVEPGKGMTGDLSDPRITIGIAFSPQGLGTSRFGTESFRSIDRPLLCFSGTQDEQLGHDMSLQPARNRLKGFELMPAGDKYLLWLENADHLCFTASPKDHLLPSKARPDAQRIAREMTRLFCDYYLKGNKEAKRSFNRRHANSLCGEVVTKVTWYEK